MSKRRKVKVPNKTTIKAIEQSNLRKTSKVDTVLELIESTDITLESTVKVLGNTIGALILFYLVIMLPILVVYHMTSISVIWSLAMVLTYMVAISCVVFRLYIVGGR